MMRAAFLDEAGSVKLRELTRSAGRGQRGNTVGSEHQPQRRCRKPGWLDWHAVQQCSTAAPAAHQPRGSCDPLQQAACRSWYYSDYSAPRTPSHAPVVWAMRWRKGLVSTPRCDRMRNLRAKAPWEKRLTQLIAFLRRSRRPGRTGVDGGGICTCAAGWGSMGCSGTLARRA